MDHCQREGYTIPINPQQLFEHNKKVAKENRIILDSMKDHLIPHILGKMAQDMYEAFISLYKSVDVSRKMLLRNKLTIICMSDIDTGASYLMNILKLHD